MKNVKNMNEFDSSAASGRGPRRRASPAAAPTTEMQSDADTNCSITPASSLKLHLNTCLAAAFNLKLHLNTCLAAAFNLKLHLNTCPFAASIQPQAASQHVSNLKSASQHLSNCSIQPQAAS